MVTNVNVPTSTARVSGVVDCTYWGICEWYQPVTWFVDREVLDVKIVFTVDLVCCAIMFLCFSCFSRFETCGLRSRFLLAGSSWLLVGRLHSPCLVPVGLSVVHEMWSPVVWHHPFVIGWSKCRLGLPQLLCIQGSHDRWELPFSQGPLAVTLHNPNGRLIACRRAVQRDCERV